MGFITSAWASASAFANASAWAKANKSLKLQADKERDEINNRYRISK
jgi:hypothetical protein